LQGKKCKKYNFFQNQNDTCAHLTSSLFTLVMTFHDRQSSERCIRKLISRHCFEKTRTRWNDFLFLITDDRDFRPQTCTNGLVFRGCKHIKNIFEDVYFTKNSFHITLSRPFWKCNVNICIITSWNQSIELIIETKKIVELSSQHYVVHIHTRPCLISYYAVVIDFEKVGNSEECKTIYNSHEKM
jgi:hypothetical protein